MKEGTKSLLFGCHQFILHPIFVIIAWYKLGYGNPKFWELVCIFLHDIGHWQKDYLSDYKQKEQHWKLGAEIALRLFGLDGWWFIAGHTRQSGRNFDEKNKNKLFFADKYSWIIAPKCWLRLNDRIEGFDKHRPIEDWLKKIEENFLLGCPKGSHQIYLEMRR